MDGFSRRTEQKRRAIIQIAETKLAEQCYNREPVQALAKQAGVSQVTIYNYFGSKDELLFAVLQHLMDRQLERYGRMLNEEADYRKLIGSIMQEETAFVKTISSYASQSSNAGVIWEKIKGAQDSKLAPFLLQLIRIGQEKGHVAEDLSEAELLFYFSMYQKQLVEISSGKHRDQPPDGIITEERLIRFFFYGISG